MSISINMKTPNKEQLSNMLKSVAGIIEISSNDTVTINLKVDFNIKKKD